MAARQPTTLNAAALARWPVPEPGNDADKEQRGRVLVVAGSQEMPGAALLAAVAALRAGAGKLTVAAPQVVATGLALAIPESRVIGLVETRNGFSSASYEALATVGENVNAVVAGPGMQDEQRSLRFIQRLLPLFRGSTVVPDALAMSIVRSGALTRSAVLTPHAGEVAGLTGLSKQQVHDDPLSAARAAAKAWNCCVALKGATTFVAMPDGAAWRFTGGTPGLATSGSGDTLAGLIGGLCARGMMPVAACAWGVALHAGAGHALVRKYGPLGYLARELSAEVPALLETAARRQRCSRKSRPSG